MHPVICSICWSHSTIHDLQQDWSHKPSCFRHR